MDFVIKKYSSVEQNLKDEKFTSEKNVAVQPRQFGCGQGIFTYIANDFDATPPGFEEYILQ